MCGGFDIPLGMLISLPRWSVAGKHKAIIFESGTYSFRQFARAEEQRREQGAHNLTINKQ